MVKNHHEKFFHALSLAAGLAGCAEMDVTSDEGEEIAAVEQELLDGEASLVRPAIGQISVGCTATLVDARYIVTAAHCFDYFTGSYAVANRPTFYMQDEDATDFPFKIERVYSLGVDPGENLPSTDDIAFARLTTAADTALFPPAKFGAMPASGADVTIWGYGCHSRDDVEADTGYKQYVETKYNPNLSTKQNCQGDSGGPRTLGLSESLTSTIYAINSGFINDLDVNGDAVTWGNPMLRAVRAFGATAVTNKASATFATLAAQGGARALGGDFTGDQLGDVVLLGGAGWTKIYTGKGDGAGILTLLEQNDANLAGLAFRATSKVAGDFNGDGKTDIALLGGHTNNVPWTDIKILVSSGNGTYSLQSWASPTLADMATDSGAYAVAGDFDADGRSDIALLGGAGWPTIPVGLAKAANPQTFLFSNKAVARVPGWSRTSGARPLVGDFDKDGDDDLALSGGLQWTSTPLALSDRTGGFVDKAPGSKDFQTWSRVSGVKLVAGDFDGDGDADIAAVGGAGWRNVRFNLSSTVTSPDGTKTTSFSPALFPITDVPGWGNVAQFVVATKLDKVANNAQATKSSDLVITGRAGWTTVPQLFLKK